MPQHSLLNPGRVHTESGDTEVIPARHAHSPTSHDRCKLQPRHNSLEASSSRAHLGVPSQELNIDSGIGSSPHLQQNPHKEQLSSSPELKTPPSGIGSTPQPLPSTSGPVPDETPASLRMTVTPDEKADIPHITESTLHPHHMCNESGIIASRLLQEHPNLDPDKINKHIQHITDFWLLLTKEAQSEFPEFACCFNDIKTLNTPNFLGARITLKSGLNLPVWERELSDYHDREICSYLRHGWPVGYKADKPPVSVTTNHHSGDQHLPHVRKFIKKELQHAAIVGPFKHPPFSPWTRVSPILTRPKKESADRCIIIDLFFPKGTLSTMASTPPVYLERIRPMSFLPSRT